MFKLKKSVLEIVLLSSVSGLWRQMKYISISWGEAGHNFLYSSFFFELLFTTTIKLNTLKNVGNDEILLLLPHDCRGNAAILDFSCKYC